MSTTNWRAKAHEYVEKCHADESGLVKSYLRCTFLAGVLEHIGQQEAARPNDVLRKRLQEAEATAAYYRAAAGLAGSDRVELSGASPTSMKELLDKFRGRTREY